MHAIHKQNAAGCVSEMIALSAKALVVLCALLHFNPAQAQGSSDTAATVTVRNMAEAMDTLVSRYGYVVTLETPRYLYDGDMEDQPVQFRNDADRVANGTAPKIVVAKGNPLALSLPSSTGVGGNAMASIANQLAQTASKSDHGAHFRVEQVGDVFHLIPTEIRDASGNWVPLTPIFDTEISIPTEQRSLLETVKAVCSALEIAANVRVGLLQVPMRTLVNSSSSVGATNESARGVLTRALVSSGSKMTWRVFYDEPLRKYLLSIFYVPGRSSGANGTNGSKNSSITIGGMGTSATGNSSPASTSPKH